MENGVTYSSWTRFTDLTKSDCDLPITGSVMYGNTDCPNSYYDNTNNLVLVINYPSIAATDTNSCDIAWWVS